MDQDSPLLRPDFTERLVAQERLAFAAYCNQRGDDPSASEKAVLRAIKQEQERWIEHLSLKSVPIPPKLQAYLTSVLSSTDLWSAKHLISSSIREGYCRSIVREISRLPINHTYVRKLSHELHLSKDTSNEAKVIQNLVISIPFFHRFDLQFNAFVSRESLVDGVPCICIYEILKTVTDFFPHLILPVILKEAQGAIDVMPSAECQVLASQPDFMFSLKSCFDALFGGFDYIAVLRCIRTSSHLSMGKEIRTLIAEGAQDFIAYHEYGHLLGGHFAIGPCRKVEDEADFFAILMITSKGNFSDEFWFFRLLGAVSLHILLLILEQKYGEVNDSTHPSARDRMWLLMEALNLAVNSSVVPILRSYVENIVTACNPTLKMGWGFTIDLEFSSVGR